MKRQTTKGPFHATVHGSVSAVRVARLRQISGAVRCCVCSRIGERISNSRRTPYDIRLPRQLKLTGCYYDFIRRHAALQFGRENRALWMVAGLHKRVCSFQESFVFALNQQPMNEAPPWQSRLSDLAITEVLKLPIAIFDYLSGSNDNGRVITFARVVRLHECRHAILTEIP